MRPLVISALVLCAVVNAIKSNTRGGWVQDTTNLETTFAPVRLTFVLQPADETLLTETFNKISDPLDARFRQYLTKAEITKVVQPRPGAALALRQWWSDTHSDTAEQWTASAHGDLLTLEASRTAVESAFQVKMALFTHPDTSKSHKGLLRTIQQHVPLPTPLQNSVVAVLGLSDLSPPPRAVHRPRCSSLDKESCDFKGDIIDPLVIAKQYGERGRGEHDRERDTHRHTRDFISSRSGR